MPLLSYYSLLHLRVMGGRLCYNFPCHRDLPSPFRFSTSTKSRRFSIKNRYRIEHHQVKARQLHRKRVYVARFVPNSNDHTTSTTIAISTASKPGEIQSKCVIGRLMNVHADTTNPFGIPVSLVAATVTHHSCHHQEERSFVVGDYTESATDVNRQEIG